MTAAEKTAWDALQADRDALFAENAGLKAQAAELEETQKVRDTLTAENEALKKASAELLAENDALKASTPAVAAAGPVEYVIDPNDPEPPQDPYAGTDTPAWKAWAERRTIKQ